MDLSTAPLADPLIHPTAVIAPGAVIGEGARIGPYAVIGPQVRLGRDTTVGPHAVIDGVTTIGERNRIFQGASVGAEPQHDAWPGGPAPLVIGDDNVVREFVTISGGVQGPTIIGSGNMFMTGGAIVTQDVPPFCLVQGDRARLVSLNAVGLKRAGFSAADLAALRRAFRALFADTAPLAERIAAVRARATGPVAQLVDFLEAPGRSPVTTLRRRVRAAA